MISLGVEFQYGKIQPVLSPTIFKGCFFLITGKIIVAHQK